MQEVSYCLSSVFSLPSLDITSVSVFCLLKEIAQFFQKYEHFLKCNIVFHYPQFHTRVFSRLDLELEFLKRPHSSPEMHSSENRHLFVIIFGIIVGY